MATKAIKNVCSFSNLMIFLINSSSRMLRILQKHPLNSHFRDRKKKKKLFVVSYNVFFFFFVLRQVFYGKNEFICVKCGKKIEVSHHWSPMIPEFSAAKTFLQTVEKVKFIVAICRHENPIRVFLCVCVCVFCGTFSPNAKFYDPRFRIIILSIFVFVLVRPKTKNATDNTFLWKNIAEKKRICCEFPGKKKGNSSHYTENENWKVIETSWGNGFSMKKKDLRRNLFWHHIHVLNLLI